MSTGDKLVKLDGLKDVYNNLNGKASELKSAFDSLDLIGEDDISLSYIENSYVDKTDGVFRPYTGWKRTDYIPIGIYYEFITQASTLGNLYNAFYDADKIFIQAFTIYTSKETLTPPANARYFAVSCDDDNVYTIKGKYIYGRDSIREEINDSVDYIEKTYTGNTRNLLNAPAQLTVTGSVELPVSVPAGTYTISFDSVVKTHQNSLLFGLYDSVSAEYVYGRIQDEADSLVISVSHSANKLIVYSNTNYEYSQGATTTYNNLRLVAGTINLPYVPYGVTAVDLQARADAEYKDPYPIPAYWEGNVATAEHTVKNRKYTRSEHDVIFPFITDTHWTDNAKTSPNLVNRICNDLGLPFAVFGGDALTRHAQSSYGIKFLEQFIEKFKFPVICTVGNHDNNSDNKSDTSVIISDENLYAIMYRPFELFYDTDHTISHGLYDDVSQKVRYIQIDTGTPFWNTGSETIVDQTKLNDAFSWASDKINELSAEWSVVIFTHMYFTSGTNVSSYVSAAINTYILTPDFNATLLAMFVGHTHKDSSVIHTYNGKNLLVVSTMQDAYSPLQNTESGYTMTKGTDTEQAFDIVEIDITNKKIYMTRVGVGENREIDIP